MLRRLRARAAARVSRLGLLAAALEQHRTAPEAAVRGMERLLSGSPDVLVTCEFWPQGVRESGGDPAAVLDYYRSLGFGVRVELPDEKGVLDWDDDELLARCGAQGHANLVLARGR